MTATTWRRGCCAQNSDALRLHASALNHAEAGQSAASARKAFELAQWALQSDAAEALAQMSARLAKGEGPLVDLVRKRQDLMARRHREDKRLLAAVGRADAGAVQALRASIANLDKRSCGDRRRAERQISRVCHASPSPSR